MPANETRGEIALTFDGKDYGLRPTFEAIEAIESRTGRGLIELAIRAEQGQMTRAELAMIAGECIRAWGKAVGDMGGSNVTDKGVARAISEAPGGIALATTKVRLLLLGAISGGYTASGEVKAVAATEATGSTPAAA